MAATDPETPGEKFYAVASTDAVYGHKSNQIVKCETGQNGSMRATAEALVDVGTTGILVPATVTAIQDHPGATIRGSGTAHTKFKGMSYDSSLSTNGHATGNAAPLLVGETPKLKALSAAMMTACRKGPL